MTTSKPAWKAIRLLFLGCLLAFCVKAQATITLNVTSPVAGAFVGNSLHIVVANVTSTYQIQSVTATVAGRLTNLTFDATAGWMGDLSLAGLPLGPQTLSLSATDVFGNSGQAQVSFVHNQPPVLTVLEPTSGSLARPYLHVVANATSDDPGGVFIQVYGKSATNSLDTFVDLSQWDGRGIWLSFTATDSAGQTTAAGTFVYLFGNTNVVEIARVSSPILDASADAILFFDGTDLKSKSVINGAEQVLLNRSDVPVEGSLTPHGAIFETRAEKGYEGYEVRDGTLIDLGPIYFNFKVKGNYAIWITGTYGSTPVTLTLRDLLAGTNVMTITNDNINIDGNDVAANGDVVYWTNEQIYRYRNGNSTYVGSGGNPITDGVNVSYVNGSGDYTLFDGTSETILGPQQGVVGIDRALSAGWTAFLKPGTGQSQVWTRSPYGVQTQRTFFGSSSAVYALGPSGDLMAYSNGRLYFIPNASTPTLPTDLGPWNFPASPPFWSKGNWYATIGTSLVAFVVPSAPAISSFGWNTNSQFSFHIAAGLRQKVVTQESTDLFNWTSLSTNFVGTTFGIDAAFPPASGSNKKFYRVISVH